MQISHGNLMIVLCFFTALKIHIKNWNREFEKLNPLPSWWFWISSRHLKCHCIIWSLFFFVDGCWFLSWFLLYDGFWPNILLYLKGLFFFFGGGAYLQLTPIFLSHLCSVLAIFGSNLESIFNSSCLNLIKFLTLVTWMSWRKHQ